VFGGGVQDLSACAVYTLSVSGEFATYYYLGF
jgi:hypothetical protein